MKALTAEPSLPESAAMQAPPGSRSRRIMWLLLVVGFLAVPFLSAPGVLIRDTRDTLWFNPGAYLSRGWSLWLSNPYLGQQQHDGILVPMALGVWLLRSLSLPLWVVERLWHGALLITTAGTTILLVDGLRGRKTVAAPVIAGLAYTLTPFVVGYGLELTPVLLPYAFLPLLLLVVLRGAGRSGLLWPALFGLVTLLMGGGNGAPQVYVLLAAVALIAWLVFAQRTVDLRRGLKFAGWSLLFFVALNSWWLFLLGSPEVFNALKFSEQPPVINVTSSASEALRGLGFWAFYGGNQFGAWLTPARPYVTDPILVFTGFLVPIGALVSAWLVRWKYRLYFLLSAVAAVFVSTGIFPFSHPSPFGRALLFAYAHVPGVAGLRTTYKVTPELNLALAVLAGVGFEALWLRARRAGRQTLARAAVLASVMVVLGANGYPFWTGRLYNSARGTGEVPGYWQQALGELDARDVRYRAFFAPSAYWTTYTWGSIKEGVVATDPNLNAANPWLVPIDQRYGSNLEAAIEEPYLDGASPAGTAQLFRYLGVRDVVLQNDLNWRRSVTASPSELRALLGDPELRPSLRFGLPGQNVLGASPTAVDGGSSSSPQESSISPVQVLSVQDPAPIIRAEPPVPIVVSGDGFGVANAARQGLLQEGTPLLYSGALTPETLQEVLAREMPSFVVTDTNRREVRRFSAPRSSHSYTLAAGQTLNGAPIGYLLFGDREATQSVAVYPGLSAITASGYGAVFGASPQYRPANAFDGDPTTWWAVGIGSSPAGAWIQATLAKPTRIASITIGQPDAVGLREVRGVRLTFSDGSAVPGILARGRAVTVSFPARVTSSVRITLTQVGGEPIKGHKAGAALSDVDIAGLHPVELIQTPTDLFDAARKIPGGMERLATAPFVYLFERARSNSPGPAEEVRIARRFEVAGTRDFSLGGTVHVDQTAPDSALAAVMVPPGPVTVSASSRLLGKPAYWGPAAMDGDPSTEWVASPAQPESLSIQFASHVIDNIVVDSDPGRGRIPIMRIRAVFSDGSTVSGSTADPTQGVIRLRFSPREESGVTLKVEGFAPSTGSGLKFFGIEEVHIPGVDPLNVAPNASAQCTQQGVDLDGRAIGVRPLGTVGDLLAGRDLSVATCGDEPITLSPGWHSLVAGGALVPDVLKLSTGYPQTHSAAHTTMPTVTANPGWSDRATIRIQGATGPYYLVIGQNWDPHWRASIDGRDLGSPMLLDGYSAGWLIDHVGSYTVSVRYGKQSIYSLALLLTGATLLFAFGVVIANALRKRNR
jgi:arabinofuranan 3-O-arabinosyltransferase